MVSILEQKLAPKNLIQEVYTFMDSPQFLDENTRIKTKNYLDLLEHRWRYSGEDKYRQPYLDMALYYADVLAQLYSKY